VADPTTTAACPIVVRAPSASSLPFRKVSESNHRQFRQRAASGATRLLRLAAHGTGQVPAAIRHLNVTDAYESGPAASRVTKILER
jgi:hypothetical protein